MIPVTANVKSNDIISTVAKRLRVKPEMITEKNREPWRTLVRFAIAWVLVNEYNWTCSAAADVVRKERTTIHYGNGIIDSLMEADESFIVANPNLSKQRDVVLLVADAIRTYFNSIV